jgi:hypothetical protein
MYASYREVFGEPSPDGSGCGRRQHIYRGTSSFLNHQLVNVTRKATQASGMKSVLRNIGSTHNVGNAHHHSFNRRQLRTVLKISETTVTSALLGALGVALSGCSGAEIVEYEVAPSATPVVIEKAPVEMVGQETIQRGTNDSDDVVSTPAAAPSEHSERSPRGGNQPVDAPASGTTSGDPEADDSAAPAAVARDTMTTSGRQLLDSCGNPFVTRGVEQIFGEQLPQGNDWVGLVEQIAASGVNAVRILASTDTLDTNDVDRLLDVVAEHGMVAYITPYGNEGMRWLEGQDARAMLAEHEKHILIDAFGEPTFDDRERFVADSTDAIRQVRSWGYRVPLTVTANQFGRDLPSLLELGAEIVASDPLHNTVLGWQAYWSQGGYYQDTYGMSLTEAVDAISRAPFPIQLGLDRITDFPASDTADYGTLMSATETHGIGWLWWDWYNPYGRENNLTDNGSATALTATGTSVIKTHAASVENTAKLSCTR